MSLYQYLKAHRAVRDQRGPAKDHLCPCGAPAVHWAYQHTGEPIYAANGCAYTLNVDDYLAMCRKCHFALDAEKNPEARQRAAQNVAAKRQLDPEYDHHIRTTRQNNMRRAREALSIRRYEDPELAARLRENATARGLAGGAATSKLKHRCVECGKESTPGGIGRHQQISGHAGVAK